jgi:hypothetical protein
MKNTIFRAYKTLLGLVLFFRVLSWIIDFNEVFNRVINIAMFSLIGIAYLVMGRTFENKLIKIVSILSGLFLIGMNFFKQTDTIAVIGIVCIVTPMLIVRFSKENTEKPQVA